MKMSTIQLRKLEPDVGKVLTNGEAYAEKELYLGCNDKPENWHEISVEEYASIKKEMEKQEEI